MNLKENDLILEGDYKVVKFLASGGFGHVYKVKHKFQFSFCQNDLNWEKIFACKFVSVLFRLNLNFVEL